jgi:hypothetical protein
MMGTHAEDLLIQPCRSFFAAADCSAILHIREIGFGFVILRISALRGNRRDKNRTRAAVKPGFALSRYQSFVVAANFCAGGAYRR